MFQKIRHKLFPPSPYQWQDLESGFKGIKESEAQLFVIWSKQDLSLSALEADLKTQVEKQRFSNCKLWLRDNTIKNFTLRDQSPQQLGKVVALVSAENISELEVSRFLTEIKGAGFSIAAYKVRKSIPLTYAIDWQKGTKSPGLVSLSFFRKKSGMSTQAFKEYWFGAHTPFALDIHPLWHYERNAVEQCVTQGMPGFDAIVPLHLKQDEDLKFSRFFGVNGKNPLVNALRIQSDVEHFINLKQIQTVAMREFILS